MPVRVPVCVCPWLESAPVSLILIPSYVNKNWAAGQHISARVCVRMSEINAISHTCFQIFSSLLPSMLRCPHSRFHICLCISRAHTLLTNYTSTWNELSHSCMWMDPVLGRCVWVELDSLTACRWAPVDAAWAESPAAPASPCRSERFLCLCGRAEADEGPAYWRQVMAMRMTKVTHKAASCAKTYYFAVCRSRNFSFTSRNTSAALVSGSLIFTCAWKQRRLNGVACFFHLRKRRGQTCVTGPQVFNTPALTPFTRFTCGLQSSPFGWIPCIFCFYLSEMFFAHLQMKSNMLLPGWNPIKFCSWPGPSWRCWTLLRLIYHCSKTTCARTHQQGFTAHGGRVFSRQTQEQILSSQSLLQDYFIAEHWDISDRDNAAKPGTDRWTHSGCARESWCSSYWGPSGTSSSLQIALLSLCKQALDTERDLERTI